MQGFEGLRSDIRFSDDVLRIRDIELRLWGSLASPEDRGPDCIYLFKDERFLSALTNVLDRVMPRRMIELGIYRGGSTIYWNERYALEKLLAFELAPGSPQLQEYLSRHQLTDQVRTYFGVSQTDGNAIRAAIARDFSGNPLDAVVDDASHQLMETRASVEILLPHVRPGGVYVIEDWAWGHHKNWPPGAWAERPLMSPLLVELMLVCGSGKGVIDNITIDANFAVLWRGAAPLPTDGSFRLLHHYNPRNLVIAQR